MSIKIYKPTTSTLRHKIGIDYRKDGIKKVKLPKSLLGGVLKRQGRSSQTGRITVRRRGGGVKKLYRKVDFKGKDGRVPGVVETLIYDPNRSAFLALVKYSDGDKRLLLATKDMKAGFKIDENLDVIREGTRLPLEQIPVGVEVHNIELNPGQGGKLVRSAGVSAFLAGIVGGFAQIKLPSGELRLINKKCKATVGKIGNEDVRNVKLGKAGSSRQKGIRPSVTGKAMNAVDHPHGGGKAHQSIGMAGQKTKWGKPAMGVRTRKRKNPTNKFIIKRRYNK
ncbi:MAG: 50S ribosomal protein L2 [Patescibacteria group bacterium]